MNPVRLVESAGVKFIEDRIVWGPRSDKGKQVCGVLDAMSRPYLPKDDPMLFGDEKKSGGQMAADIAVATLHDPLLRELPLKEIMLFANRKLRDFRQWYFPSEKGSFANPMPGSAFALAQIDEVQNSVPILTGEDSFAVWKLRHQKEWCASPHQGYASELELETRFRNFKRQHGTNGLWEFHGADMLKYKSERFNVPTSPNKTAFLNGDPRLCECWHEEELPLDQLEWLLLFTDGLVPMEMTETPEKLAQYVSVLFLNGGLGNVRSETCKMLSEMKVSAGEVAALAIPF